MSEPDADAILRAQLEHLRSDDRLRELAALAADMTPEERLQQAWAMSRSAAAMLEGRPDPPREPLGPGAPEVLRRLSDLAHAPDAE